MMARRLATLGEDGKWPDSEIDYTTGCTARRANWYFSSFTQSPYPLTLYLRPAENHWSRIGTWVPQTLAVSALKVERSHHGGSMARRARRRGKLREQLNFIRRDLASHGLLVRERLHGPRLSRLWRPPGVPMRHARLLEHELVLQRKSPLALTKGITTG